ncbi:uncharacterized protein Bfra_009415 [Botrytis fragariae]|uniref:Uncharacterized protein n=1 Tax=Botrytis fragariae TaxID=1964551 RepID=A0A8H6AP92_9HELO|nr:uncharacterized protein Bfra_009415 [Botrytis fragariae]KAF5870860.1 hypothetical protein Bfra_009415 [Botrytis fragariae]
MIKPYKRFDGIPHNWHAADQPHCDSSVSVDAKIICEFTFFPNKEGSRAEVLHTTSNVRSTLFSDNRPMYGRRLSLRRTQPLARKEAYFNP